MCSKRHELCDSLLYNNVFLLFWCADILLLFGFQNSSNLNIDCFRSDNMKKGYIALPVALCVVVYSLTLLIEYNLSADLWFNFFALHFMCLAYMSRLFFLIFFFEKSANKFANIWSIAHVLLAQIWWMDAVYSHCGAACVCERVRVCFCCVCGLLFC